MSERTKTAIVTGGNSGIGEAIVRALAARGMNVVVVGRRQEENLRVVRSIESECGVKGLAVEADVSNEEDCVGLIEKTCAEFGMFHLLVNNAGIVSGQKVVDSDTATFERVIRTNVYSTYWCSREAYRVFLKNEIDEKSDLRGSIINISSVCGVDGWAGTGAYSASKHAMMGLTRSMAEEGSDDAVRVAAVCPAMVSTPMTGVSGSEYISPEDIAATVTYLLDLSVAAWPTEIVVNRRGAD